jgi:hypothetical protein
MTTAPWLGRCRKRTDYRIVSYLMVKRSDQQEGRASVLEGVVLQSVGTLPMVS